MPYRELGTPEALKAAVQGIDHVIIDATERAYRRSQDDTKQREHYSGKKNGSLVISGVHNYLIFQANKAYPDRSRWIRWNKCLTFTIPYQRRLMTLILLF